MVASAAPGDGKTTVARHLAGAAARMGSRVLLLEADLRRPAIAVQLDVSSGPGVADLVVVDTPPLTAVSDAFPLLSKVDGVIIVGRVGRNRRDVAQRLYETLTGAGAPLLGVVANGLKSGRRGGYGSSRGRLRSSQKSFRWVGRVFAGSNGLSKISLRCF
jgi:Mrp family chromosome partitioning ATPase